MRSPNELFAALMDEAACSRSALARDIRELAAARGLDDVRCDHVDVGRWLSSLATSYLDAGDVLRACDTAAEALVAAGRIKSARVRKYVRVFDRRLNDFGRQRSITEFRDRARPILAVAS